MAINLRKFLKSQSNKSKLSDFQDLDHIDGLSIATTSANLYNDKRDDLVLFYFRDSANYASVYTKSKIISENIKWNLNGNKKKTKGLLVNTRNANAFTGKKGYQGLKEIAEGLSLGLSLKQKEDEDKPEKMNMTKAEMQDNMINAMKKMKKGEMESVYAAYMNGKENMDKEPTEEEKSKSEAVEKRVKDIDVKEHVDALMNGEGDLSEEFKRKAATVFEAAVKSKVRDEVSRLEDDYRKDLDENINATRDDLTEKVDNYLNYVCEEWTKDNELAIERGLKGEIAEDFISGLKQLFEDHYIDIPNEKYDVLEAQSEKISKLEAKLSESIEKNVSLRTNNAGLVKEQVIFDMSSDLAETEIEKFKSLTEDVDFSDEDSYKEKLETLKENYFPKVKTVVAETVDNVETGNAQDIDVSSSMTAYMSAIGRVAKGQ